MDLETREKPRKVQTVIDRNGLVLFSSAKNSCCFYRYQKKDWTNDQWLVKQAH